MITTDAIGVVRVGQAVLTEAVIVASVIDGPVKTEPIAKKEWPVEIEYDYQRAKWKAISLLRQLGRTQATEQRPEEREKSYSQTHVKPVVQADVDDIVQDGWIQWELSRKAKRKDGLPRKPLNTSNSVLLAYYRFCRNKDGLAHHADPYAKGRKGIRKNGRSMRKSKGSASWMIREFGEVAVMPDSTVLELPTLRSEARQRILDLLAHGYNVKDVAKLMGVSRQYVKYHTDQLKRVIKYEEYIPLSHTVPQRQAHPIGETPATFKPAKVRTSQARIDVPAHKDSVHVVSGRIPLQVISEPFVGHIDTATWIGREYILASGATWTIIGMSH